MNNSLPVDVSLIIPCYNSAPLIERRVLEFEAVLKQTHWSWEILLCDDGSRDATAEICRRLTSGGDPRRFLPNAVNRGRGQNVMDGFRQSRGRWVGFADADCSTAATYVIPLLMALQNGYEVAEANRTYKLLISELPFVIHRYIAHKVYAWLVRKMLGIRGHDTETGFKFFQRDAMLHLLDTTQSPGWFWDTEVIANAHRQNYRVADIPSLFVRTPRMSSTVRLLRDSYQQFSQLRGYARQVKGCNLAGNCCR